jgi:hypothetical protein
VKRLYELKVTFAIDDESRQAVIDKARTYYSEAGGAWEVDDDGTERLIPAEEAVENVGAALTELLHAHPAFVGEGIELIEIVCDTEETARELVESPDESAQEAMPARIAESTDIATAAGTEALAADDLDEYEADVYLCRWPNGEFSVVTAATKREAIIALDEWAGAHPSQLHPLDSFMADFSLTDQGEIVLNQFSEGTRDVIWKLSYPELDELLSSDEVTDLSGDFKPGGRERILEAVKHERTRLWENQPKDEPTTELGKRIAAQMGTSAVVADHYVEKIAKRILESEEGEEGKPS